jgi:hypothetical protein
MNLRCGLQRLYVALALGWIVCVFLHVFSYRWMPPWFNTLSVARSVTIGHPDYFLNGWALSVWIWAAALSLLPPLIGYALAVWLWRGFRAPTHK